MKRTLLALGGVVMMVVVATGCGSTGHGSTADPTAPTAPLIHTTTTIPAPTTTIPNTTVVPTHITVPYVDAVLVKLNHVYGNALRTLLVEKKVTAQIRTDLRSIYDPPLYGEEIGIFNEGRTYGLTNVRRHPGDRKEIVTTLVSASASCIFAKVRIDESAVDKRKPLNPYASYTGLKRSSPGSLASDPNGTPWKFFDDLALAGPRKVTDPCDKPG